MKYKKDVQAIFLATIWVSASEFFRNDILLKSAWHNHYRSLGLTFPSSNLNGAVWGIWSLLFAIAVYVLVKKFSLLQTTFLAWFMAFVMMWVTIGNLKVLPYSILLLSVPLSLIETFIAGWIIQTFQA
jgi:hypothetical protein